MALTRFLARRSPGTSVASSASSSGRAARSLPAAVRHGAVPAVLAAVLLSACSGMGGKSESAAAKGGNMPPTVRVNSGVLTDPQGLTLYTFDRDAAGSGKSVCNGQCAVAWPPLLAQPGTAPTGQYTIVTRDDGTRQWAYRGMPLYRFAKDANPGDRSGDGVNNVWRVAKP